MRRLRAVVLMVFVLAGVAVPATAHAALPPTPKWITIPSVDGVKLKGIVFLPPNMRPGQTYPAIAFAAAWNGGAEQNSAPSYRLAQKGYVVLSYTTRGTGKDGDGKVDMGGPLDLADMRVVIDTLIARYQADPQRIGAAGISYGAGIALMASGVDKRIRTVMAASTWTDMGRALYPNETRNSWPGFILWASARMASHVGAEFLGIFNNFFELRDQKETLDWAYRRSPISFVDRINANQPAIMIANGWNELIFPPDQIVDFYEKLRTPKRLYLRPGDHVGQETWGLLGLQSPVLSRMYQWFDETLKDPSKAQAAGSEIELEPRAPWGDRSLERFSDWSQISTGSRRWYLGGRGRSTRADGTLADVPQTGWSYTVKPGLNVVSNTGGPIVTGWSEVWWRRPFWTEPKFIDRLSSGTWVSPPLTDWVKLRGAPKVHVTITPTHAKGFLSFVMWSVTKTGAGRFITHAPITWRGRKPGVPFTLDLPLRPNAFNVPPGERILLAASTFEINYSLERNDPAARIAFSSPAADPSWIELPTK